MTTVQEMREKKLAQEAAGELNRLKVLKKANTESKRRFTRLIKPLFADFTDIEVRYGTTHVNENNRATFSGKLIWASPIGEIEVDITMHSNGWILLYCKSGYKARVCPYNHTTLDSLALPNGDRISMWHLLKKSDKISNDDIVEFLTEEVLSYARRKEENKESAYQEWMIKIERPRYGENHAREKALQLYPDREKEINAAHHKAAKVRFRDKISEIAYLSSTDEDHGVSAVNNLKYELLATNKERRFGLAKEIHAVYKMKTQEIHWIIKEKDEKFALEKSLQEKREAKILEFHLQVKKEFKPYHLYRIWYGVVATEDGKNYVTEKFFWSPTPTPFTGAMWLRLESGGVCTSLFVAHMTRIESALFDDPYDNVFGCPQKIVKLKDEKTGASLTYFTKPFPIYPDGSPVEFTTPVTRD